jgi:hypothetical protein
MKCNRVRFKFRDLKSSCKSSYSDVTIQVVLRLLVAKVVSPNLNSVSKTSYNTF